MPKCKYGDMCTYGWWVGTYIQFSDTVYRYIGRNTHGDHVLENIDNGHVFLAKVVSKV